MTTKIVEGKEYIVEDIPGKGVCLVPKNDNNLLSKLKLGDYITYKTIYDEWYTEIGRVIYINNQYCIQEFRNYSHIWFNVTAETLEELVTRLNYKFTQNSNKYPNPKFKIMESYEDISQ